MRWPGCTLGCSNACLGKAMQVHGAWLTAMLILVCLIALPIKAERGRSWCYYGSFLCRGPNTARTAYEQTAAVTIDGLVYVYGGRSASTSDSIYGSTYAEEINMLGMSLQQLYPGNGGPISGRAGHASVAWAPGNGTTYMLVFGGTAYTADKTTVLLNDVQALNLGTTTWVTLAPTASAGASGVPEPRKYAGMSLVDNTLLAIFGGQAINGTYLSDLWLFNLYSQTWWGPLQYKAGSSTPPTAAADVGMAYAGSSLLLYGGWTRQDGTFNQTSGNPPTTITVSTAAYTLSKTMWAIDMTSKPWLNSDASSSAAQVHCYQVALTPAQAGTVMAGLDTSMSFHDNSLIITAMGGAATAPTLANAVNNQVTWKQWLAVYNVTGISTLASAIAAASPGQVLSMPVTRLALWTNAGSAAGLVNIDGTPLDLTSGQVASWPKDSPNFVRTAGIAIVPARTTVLVMGGAQESGSSLLTAYSQDLSFDWTANRGLDLDASIKPSDYMSTDGSSTTVYKTMLMASIPQDNGSNDPAAWFFGHFDTSQVASPDLANILMYDITQAKQLASCTSAGRSVACAAVNISAAGGPANRNFYTATSTQLTFPGSLMDGTTFSSTATVVLIYGGSYVTGGKAPGKVDSLSQSAAKLQSALQTCDTTGALSVSLAKTLASCAWNKISSICTGGSTTGGSSGVTQVASARRRLAAYEPYSQSDAGLTNLQPGQMMPHFGFSASPDQLGMQAQDERAVSELLARMRQLLQTTSSTQTQHTTWTNWPLVAVYQDPARSVLQSRKAGAAVLFVKALNLTGGDWHTPGPRQGAASCNTASSEMLILGGRTYASSNTEDTDPQNSTSSTPVLSMDLYIMKLYVGGTSVSQPSISPCPANTTCTSVAALPSRPMATLPSTAPTLNATANQPSMMLPTYCCSNGDVYQLTMYYSIDGGTASGQGFQIFNWSDGGVIASSAQAAYDGWALGNGAQLPASTSLQYSWNITLPTNTLYQIVLTQDNGRGWVHDKDVLRDCCNMTAPNLNTTCCPRLTLHSLNCSGGTPVADNALIWDSRASQAADPSLVALQWRIGLKLCTGPSPPTAPYFQYPLEQRGVYAYSYELLPAAASPLPPSRHRHAITTMNDALMQGFFGDEGIIAMFGGTTDPDARNPTLMLNDLWVFFLTNHTWQQLQPSGEGPKARIGHSMASYKSQLFIGGGETYDNRSRTWQMSSDVYSLDFSLGNNMKWRQLTGGDGVLINSTSMPAYADSCMVYSSLNNQVMLNLPTDLYFVPITERLASKELLPGGDSAVLDSLTLVKAMSQVYDGDTIILDNVQLLSITEDVPVVITAGLFIQGNTYSNSRVQTQSVAADPGTSNTSNTTIPPPPSGRRRRLYRVATKQWLQVGVNDSSPTMAPTHLEQQALSAGVNGRRQLLAAPYDLVGPTDTSLGPTAGYDSRRSLISISSLQSVALQPGPDGGVMTSSFVTSLLAEYSGLWGAAFTVVDCAGVDGSTAFKYLSGSSTIANLMIVNCRDTAVVVSGSAQVMVQKVIFYNNTGTLGGALRTESGGLVNITDTVFLNNTAVNGSAIYVAAGGILNAVATTSFHGNGQGSEATYGGAIHVAGGCMSDMADSVFAWNGLSSANASSSVAFGGALYLDSPMCAFNATGTSFINNAVATSGGAVAATNVGSGTLLAFTLCTFTSNMAGGPGVDADVAYASTGGAMYLRTVYGQLQLASCGFRNNTARRSGGGVWASLVTSITGTDLEFTGNAASIAAGGGWYGEKDGRTRLSGCVFMDNTAKYGAGLAANRDLDIQLTSSTFSGNVAEDRGGAVEGDSCTFLGLVKCILSNNSAASAGGVVLADLTSGNITGSTFINNRANTGSLTATTCDREGAGAGGALCMTLQGLVGISNCTFVDNTATNGGAMHITQRCKQSEDSSCMPAELGNPLPLTFQNNTAQGGGGGVLWLYEVDDMQLNCSGATPFNTSGLPHCSDWLLSTGSTNTSYAPGIATSATQMSFLSPANGTVQNYLSSNNVQSFLLVSVQIQDAFNQTIAGGSDEATAQVTAQLIVNANEDLPAALSGSTVDGAENGVSEFVNMRLTSAMAGAYVVEFSVTGLLHKVDPIDLAVGVRPCLVGETTNADHTECNPCKSDTYSVSNSSLTCEDCPSTEASCNYAGKSDDLVPVGAILVPLDGYWHSHPQSGQIHSCVNENACSGDDWRDSRYQLLQYQKDLVYGMPLNETEYNTLQCGQGYHGNLCYGCVDGYGRQGKGVCAKCPPIGANTMYYILANLFSVVMIIITIRAQLQQQDKDDGSEPIPQNDKTTARLKSLAKFIKYLMNWIKKDSSQDRDDDKADDQSDKGDDDLSEKDDDSGSTKDGGDDEGGKGKDSTDDAASKDPKMGPGLAARKKAVVKATSGDEPSKEGDEAKAVGHDDEGHEEVSAPPQAIAMKILINYLQIAAIVKGVDLTWPDIVQSFLEASDDVSNGVGTMVSLDCSLSGTTPKAVQGAIITVATPLVIFGLSVPIWALIWLNMRWHKGADNAPVFRPYITNRLIITGISVVFYFYASLTRQILTFFSCPTLDRPLEPTNTDGTALAVGDWWSEDYNVKCYAGAHLVLVLALGIPGVIFFSIGVPAATAMFLSRNRDKLHSKSFIATYGFLYGDYEDKYFYWESCVMARKFVVVVVVVFLTNVGTDMQLVVSLGVIILAMIAHMLCSPFRVNRLDRVEFLSLWGSTLIIYIALYFVITSTSQKFKVTLSFLLVIANSVLVGMLALQVMKEWLYSAFKTMDIDQDGLLSRADIRKYLTRMQRRGKSSRMYMGAAMSFMLELLARPRWQWLAPYIILYPCEHFDNAGTSDAPLCVGLVTGTSASNPPSNKETASTSFKGASKPSGSSKLFSSNKVAPAPASETWHRSAEDVDGLIPAIGGPTEVARGGDEVEMLPRTGSHSDSIKDSGSAEAAPASGDLGVQHSPRASSSQLLAASVNASGRASSDRAGLNTTGSGIRQLHDDQPRSAASLGPALQEPAHDTASPDGLEELPQLPGTMLPSPLLRRHSSQQGGAQPQEPSESKPV